ncbi:TetR/AcrR family transcriptional regulator [Mycolicibacterium sp. Dal123E01]|uniref:TetR/AcrR family transcriptional regulator n=1 Tax=Mycolicibacterium sp. Dal123E01 TaxID=3457578 RepID=UPI00403E64D8
MQRTARRYIARILDRLPDGVDLIAIVVESMIIVASELVHDPLLKIVSEQFENQTVAQMVANDSALTQTVKTVAEEMMKGDAGKTFRPNIPPADVAQFLISTAISMLSGNIPGIEDPDTARRYIEVFVLPALVPNPPLPQAVFRDP